MNLGKPMKDEFMLDKSVTFVNHGSFGPVPKCVFDRRIEFMHEQEMQPDLWFRCNCTNYYEESLAVGAKLLGAKTENLALVDNVTTGINAIIKSLTFEAGDKILVNSHTYDAVLQTVREQEDFKGIEIVVAEITIPINSEEEIVEVFRKEYEKHKDIKLHIFDHISSCSAILFPVKKLVKLAKEYGTMSLIDGAHAPGQVEVNVTDIDADFYSGNFHKWCFVPRSCGFLWFSPKYDGMIRPLVTSHGYKMSLNEQFHICGTKDLSSIYCLPRALKFIEEIGGMTAIQAHTDETLKYACKLLVESLGTEELKIPDSMKSPYMRLVQLPIDGQASMKTANLWTKELYFDQHVQGCFTAFQGKYWFRLSCSVYNDNEDFDRMKESLVKFLSKLKK